jgi:hypothetical protein
MPDQFDMPGPTFERAPKLSAARREENFQPQGRRIPVAIATRPRPETAQRPMPTLRPQRMSVLVRSSNARPNEAGVANSPWYVSNPTVSGLGVDDPAAAIAAAAPKPSTILLIVGAVAALYYVGFKR